MRMEQKKLQDGNEGQNADIGSVGGSFFWRVHGFVGYGVTFKRRSYIGSSHIFNQVHPLTTSLGGCLLHKRYPPLKWYILAVVNWLMVTPILKTSPALRLSVWIDDEPDY